MEPASILVASATFLAAEVARKPADAFATKLWATVKTALGKVLGREPKPTDVSVATIRRAQEDVPAVAGALQAAKSGSSGLRRAELAEKVLRGGRLLWVDDRPEHNAWERELFRSLGVVVVSAESTRSALACLQTDAFDVVVSDIARDEESGDGIEGARAMHRARPSLPVVFYVESLTSTQIPEPASGITNDPNELLHLVLDRLERTRV